MERLWPTSDATIDPRRERRTAERLPVYRGALLSISGQLTTLSCTIRDFSDKGAGIRLIGITLLPLDFDMSLDWFRTSEACRLVWRDGDFAGVVFNQRANQERVDYST
jgi:hypothetical protein